MKHYFSELANDKKMSNSLKVLEVEAEEYEEISMKYGIEAVPSFLFLKVNSAYSLSISLKNSNS
jgi:hypothetical protein